MLEPVLEEIARHFGGPRIDGDHPWLCRRTIMVPAGDVPSYRQAVAQDALDTFWAGNMPAEPDGRCLMATAPVNLRNVVGVMVRSCSIRLRSFWRAGLRAGRHAAQTQGEG